jgi:hypothetical protein
MQPIRRILVAIKNPQGKASPAIIKAGQLAQALGASLELLRCMSAGLAHRPQLMSAHSHRYIATVILRCKIV